MSVGNSDRIIDGFRHYRQSLSKWLPSLPGIPYFFLSPVFVLFSTFLAFPIVYAFYLSFFSFQGIAQEPLATIAFGGYYVSIPSIANLSFVGLDNYRRLFVDGQFRQALYNTFYIFFLQVPLMVCFAMVLALALNDALVRFKGVFRSIIILPVSANLLAYSVIFIMIISEGGVADTIFTAIGLRPIAWLDNGYWSRNLIAFMSIWRWTGYNMILLLAGLQTVSQHLYEAAELDGANAVQKFRHVTIPQMKPVLLFVFVTSTIGSLNKFAEPTLLISAGAPVPETRTVVYYIYELAFQNLELGYASAVSYALVFIVIVLTVIEMRWR